MKVKNYLLIFALSFSLFACGTNLSGVQTPVPTLTPLTGVETALATSTPFVEELASFTPYPTFTSPTIAPEVTDKPTDFSPILYGGNLYGSEFFLLVGGVSRDAWLTPEESVARFSGEVTYSLNTMTQQSKYFVWGKMPKLSPSCKIYTIGIDAGLDEAGFVGVVDGWDVVKRDVAALSDDEEYYQQAVTDWLIGEGVTAPQIGSLQILRVDIKGDGTDEVFLAASHLDGSQHTTKVGDYSIVLMRKVVGNFVLTVPLLEDIYTSQQEEITFPQTYSIANFIDLNRDGVLEVVVDVQKWEGFGAVVYQINDQEVTQVLKTITCSL